MLFSLHIHLQCSIPVYHPLLSLIPEYLLHLYALLLFLPQPLPTVPPPSICPPLPARPILPPVVPPPSGPPIPVPPPSIPRSGFYDTRMAPQFPSVGFPNSGSYGYLKVEQKKPWTAVIIDEVYRKICVDLDTVLKRDIFKKLVEASAFKALESWWDNQTKPKV